MKVTILTDASYCPDTQVAGYGYWIASNRGRVGGGGAMQVKAVTSSSAEMMAIANSLHAGIASTFVQQGDEILMQTDCMAAIQAFKFLRYNLAPQERAAVQYVERFLQQYELKIEYRHVKAHTSQEGARFVANHMCDKRAKAAMRGARIKALAQGIKEIIYERNPHLAP